MLVIANRCITEVRNSPNTIQVQTQHTVQCSTAVAFTTAQFLLHTIPRGFFNESLELITHALLPLKRLVVRHL
jgi:hypothetical protein